MRKNVAVGSGCFVDEADFGSIKNSLGISARVVRDPIETGAEQLTTKALNQHLGNVAATVATDVHNQRFFANLRIVKLDEFTDAGSSHIGNVDVADSAVAGFGDGFAIVSDPIEIDEIAFCGDRRMADVTSAVGGRLGIESELHR